MLALPLLMMAEAVGEWTIYPSYNNITEVQTGNKKVYALASGFLFSYSKADGQVETYTKNDGLSEVGISHIKWCEATKKLVIVYENSIIDLMDENGDIISVPDIYQKDMTIAKTVNSVTIQGRYAYINCGFGISKIDTSNGNVIETYNIGISVKNSAFVGGYIYILNNTSETFNIIRCDMKSNLLDKSNWKMFREDIIVTCLFSLGNELFVGISDWGIWQVNTNTAEIHKIESSFPYNFIDCSNDRLILSNGHKCNVYTSTEKYDSFSTPTNISCINYDKANGSYWISSEPANVNNGYFLNNITVNTEQQITYKSETGWRPDGPSIGSVGNITLHNDKVYIVSGNVEGKVGDLGDEGRVSMLSNGKWMEFEHGSSMTEIVNGREILFLGAKCVTVDPRDDKHVFVGARSGLYEYQDGKYVKRYGTPEGLDTKSTSDRYAYVSGSVFDRSNNLYISNNGTNPIKYLQPGATSIKAVSNVTVPDFRMISEIKFEPNTNLLWFTNYAYYYNRGLFSYNIATGQYTQYLSKMNQDGSTLMCTYYDFDFDSEGNVWVASSAGPLYLPYDERKNSETALYQHKVPRNDGTNLADYLMSGVICYAMRIDKADRKWMGTESSGLYLISSDNNQEIHHFTKDNSPLLSNTIFNIEIDHKTGRIWIATNKGLCSYMSDITEQSVEIDDSNVHAYPNPLTPEHNGHVTIVGLLPGCDVKIVSASGTLVNEGKTSGGSYIWNGCDKSGNRVASGVYMVNATTEDGEKGIVTKVAVVR